MIKATTQHGTYYIIDPENNRAKRVKGEGRNDMNGDSEWFDYTALMALTDGVPQGKIEVGKAMYFILKGHSVWDWRSSTTVVSIEDYSDENN